MLSPSCQVHEYHATFQGSHAKFKMTSVAGHVMSLDFLSRYNNWYDSGRAQVGEVARFPRKVLWLIGRPTRVHLWVRRDAVLPIELFDAETEKKESSPKMHM